MDKIFHWLWIRHVPLRQERLVISCQLEKHDNYALGASANITFSRFANKTRVSCLNCKVNAELKLKTRLTLRQNIEQAYTNMSPG